MAPVVNVGTDGILFDATLNQRYQLVPMPTHCKNSVPIAEALLGRRASTS
jgi:hypothetical protein